MAQCRMVVFLLVSIVAETSLSVSLRASPNNPPPQLPDDIGEDAAVKAEASKESIAQEAKLATEKPSAGTDVKATKESNGKEKDTSTDTGASAAIAETNAKQAFDAEKAEEKSADAKEAESVKKAVTAAPSGQTANSTVAGGEGTAGGMKVNNATAAGGKPEGPSEGDKEATVILNKLFDARSEWQEYAMKTYPLKDEASLRYLLSNPSEMDQSGQKLAAQYAAAHEAKQKMIAAAQLDEKSPFAVSKVVKDYLELEVQFRAEVVSEKSGGPAASIGLGGQDGDDAPLKGGDVAKQVAAAPAPAPEGEPAPGALALNDKAVSGKGPEVAQPEDYVSLKKKFETMIKRGDKNTPMNEYYYTDFNTPDSSLDSGDAAGSDVDGGDESALGIGAGSDAGITR